MTNTNQLVERDTLIQRAISERTGSNAVAFPAVPVLKKIENGEDKIHRRPVIRKFGANNNLIIQRRIRYSDPVITEDLNVAKSWKGGGDYAVTPSVINSKRIPPTSNKIGLIKEVGYNFIDKAPEDEENRFHLELLIPIQEVSYRLELPTDGPWVLPDIPVEEIDAFIRVYGLKSPERTAEEEKMKCGLIVLEDGNLKENIRKHELHHVREQEQAVTEILVPWDDKIEDSKSAADQLTNRDPLKLILDYKKIGPGKSAQDIADELVARLEALGNAYHDTEEGKPPVITRFEFDKPTRIYKVWLKLEKT